MTVEIKSYTDSAMSDLVKQFFNRFKEESDYKYVQLIDESIISSKVIEIDYNDFHDEIKYMIRDCSPHEHSQKERIHVAFYRAICEVFQTRHGSEELDVMRNEDSIKFTLVNSDILDSKICSNPKMVHYGNYNPEEYNGDDKINKVADELKRKNTFVTIRKSGEILLYNGKIYNNYQAEPLIKEETEKLIPNCTEHHTKEAINKIKRQTYVDIEKFDANPNLITVENGILNLETLELKPHTSEHLSRVLLPVEYHKPESDDIEENLKDTLFWKYLKASFTINGKFKENDFETVLEIIASPIIKRHVDEKAFMFLGNGENGKSVCLDYIQSILGKDNVSNISLQDIAEDKFMRANLSGMSANIFPDLEQNELRKSGKIKAITSNEGIEVQKKYEQAFTLYPFVKLMFSANRFPKVFDQDHGFFRRWLIVKWERDFENDPERIPYLREKLADNQEEKNLVFSCLVGIAKKLNTIGKFTHSKDWKTIQKEWNANADPIDDFDQNYVIDSNEHKTKRETYHFYKEIMLEKGMTPKGIGQFSKAFAEYREEDRVEIDGRTQRAWLNIAFNVPKQETLSTVDTT
jgi:P4 family phage/plasmid primase-like protien